jgi:CBS domain-containing protein
MKLSDLFTKKVITARPRDPLGAVAETMLEHNVGAVVVEENMRPVGMVTDRDLALALGAKGMTTNTPVEKIMSRHVLAVPEDTGVFTATKYIQDTGVRRLPIVDREDRLVGIVSLDDLMRCLAKELFNLAEGIESEMKVS